MFVRRNTLLKSPRAMHVSPWASGTLAAQVLPSSVQKTTHALITQHGAVYQWTTAFITGAFVIGQLQTTTVSVWAH